MFAALDAYWNELRDGAVKQTRLTAALALLLASCHGSEQSLGKFSEGPMLSVAAARQQNAQTPVVVRGTMTEKCPVAGCWFMLRDETGFIKVDTKNAGFVVINVPIKTKLLVSGHVTTNGSERLLDASGVRY
jgi:uncharacterized protein YdeI (BOF family)